MYTGKTISVNTGFNQHCSYYQLQDIMKRMSAHLFDLFFSLKHHKLNKHQSVSLPAVSKCPLKLKTHFILISKALTKEKVYYNQTNCCSICYLLIQHPLKILFVISSGLTSHFAAVMSNWSPGHCDIAVQTFNQKQHFSANFILSSSPLHCSFIMYSTKTTHLCRVGTTRTSPLFLVLWLTCFVSSSFHFFFIMIIEK